MKVSHFETKSGNQSEIAQLRAQIEQEHRAMCWALTGLSEGNAKHFFINRRYKAIGEQQARLGKLVGEEQSMEFVTEVFQQSPKQTQ